MPDLLANEENTRVSFSSLGLGSELCGSCASLGWRHPTRVQAAAIPVALKGRDLIAIANTGSGKTGAYVLPLVDWLLRQRKPPYLAILVAVPTRELAMQVTEHFSALASGVGLVTATLVGGADMAAQAAALAARPHVIIGTPGRIKDHLENTKGFSLPKLRFLIFDECDRMLEMDYGKDIDFILDKLPLERQTLFFSATFSAKIDRLQQTSLRDPVLLEVDRANSTVEGLDQRFIFAPEAQRTAYLHWYLQKEQGCSHILVFCRNAATVERLALMLSCLGHDAMPLMGAMSQENRNRALARFQKRQLRILVCTDLAQRGLDISFVDTVINYDLPATSRDYVHRVGRTARAGSSGRAITIVSQYDIKQLQEIEAEIGKRLDEYVVVEGEIAQLLQPVTDALAEAQELIAERGGDAEGVPADGEGIKTGGKHSSNSSDDEDQEQSEDGERNEGHNKDEKSKEILDLLKREQKKSFWKKKREQMKKRRKKEEHKKAKKQDL